MITTKKMVLEVKGIGLVTIMGWRRHVTARKWLFFYETVKVLEENEAPDGWFKAAGWRSVLTTVVNRLPSYLLCFHQGNQR